ncbi:hypothetical protein NHX12_017286 [Muraenolepis orangiensis]|uniref:Protein kinase domain-containing protein n=1 Tax=Muraenolepis orangiensis TaxID=630683 RepID=A0A9Q0D393_9TELE|nr:hypothetical protein NHX12_017286 [Muraenolepis orangiensis]
MTMENYLVLGNLGEGSFGKVWKCRPKNSSGRHVAVKEYLDCNIERNITREIMPLTRLRHHNLLKAFGWFVEWGKLFGVFELMDHDLMSELSGGYMGHDALRKPVDVWAIGCSAFIMATRSWAFNGEDTHLMIHEIVGKVGPPTWRQHLHYSAQCAQEELPVVQYPSNLTEKYGITDPLLAGLFEACLQMDPAHRSSCSQLLHHEYFTWDKFHHSFPKELELMVERDLMELAIQGYCPPRQTGILDTSSFQVHSSPQQRDVIVVEQDAVQSISLPLEMEVLEVTQMEVLEVTQTEGSEVLMKEQRKRKNKKKGVKAAFRNMGAATQRFFTSSVSPKSGPTSHEEG